ncbi:MAG TPA: efflux RND transporter periplasmic adaptor subunit [Steroidobacter sp.]
MPPSVPSRVLLPVFAAAAALLASGCANQSPPPPSPPEVIVETVKVQDLPLRLKYPARVVGSRVVEVRARVSGVLVERAYREGQRVKAGDVLFRIEPDSYRAAYEQAVAQVAMQRAAVAQARNDFERVQSLVEKGAVSRRDFDEANAAYTSAKAALAAAEAALKIAKLNLDYTVVRSPVSGLASKEAVTVGNVVNGASGAGGDLLTTVVQADPAYVEFSIAEPEHLRLRSLADSQAGDLPVRIVSGSQCEVVGKMDFSDTFVNTSTGTVRARAVFPNPDGCLVSGQYLSIELSGVSIPDAIAVPKEAVLFSQNGPVVWVVDDQGKVSQRPIEIQESWEDSWIVASGVQGGERIVVEGILKVRPGGEVVALTREEDAARKAKLAPASKGSPVEG